MITKEALQEAIAECQGERNPNRETCMMLAAFYTIQDHLYPETSSSTMDRESHDYSYAPPPPEAQVEQVRYSSDSEFSQAIQGQDVDFVLSVMDEAMDAMKVMLPRLYNGIMRKLEP